MLTTKSVLITVGLRLKKAICQPDSNIDVLDSFWIHGIRTLYWYFFK